MYKVFLVDDDSIILDELKDRVPWIENGFDVVGVCTDPVRAIDEISLLRPEVVFCDLKMPEMSGNEMVACVRERGINCEYVMLSAYDDYEDVRNFFKQDGFDYILKPIKDDEVGFLLEKLYIKLNSGIQDNEPVSITDNPTFNSLIAYIDENYTGRISLDQVSEMFSFNRNYICQLFRKHFGKTFSIYITEKRMDHARKLLKDKTLTISEIAYLSGYGDYHHFYRVFKNYFGYSPKEER